MGRPNVLSWEAVRNESISLFFEFSLWLGKKSTVGVFPRTCNSHFQLNTRLFSELSVGNSVEFDQRCGASSQPGFHGDGCSFDKVRVAAKRSRRQADTLSLKQPGSFRTTNTVDRQWLPNRNSGESFCPCYFHTYYTERSVYLSGRRLAVKLLF